MLELRSKNKKSLDWLAKHSIPLMEMWYVFRAAAERLQIQILPDASEKDFRLKLLDSKKLGWKQKVRQSKVQKLLGKNFCRRQEDLSHRAILKKPEDLSTALALVAQLELTLGKEYGLREVSPIYALSRGIGKGACWDILSQVLQARKQGSLFSVSKQYQGTHHAAALEALSLSIEKRRSRAAQLQWVWKRLSLWCEQKKKSFFPSLTCIAQDLFALKWDYKEEDLDHLLLEQVTLCKQKEMNRKETLERLQRWVLDDYELQKESDLGKAVKKKSERQDLLSCLDDLWHWDELRLIYRNKRSKDLAAIDRTEKTANAQAQEAVQAMQEVGEALSAFLEKIDDEESFQKLPVSIFSELDRLHQGEDSLSLLANFCNCTLKDTVDTMACSVWMESDREYLTQLASLHEGIYFLQFYSIEGEHSALLEKGEGGAYTYFDPAYGTLVCGDSMRARTKIESMLSNYSCPKGKKTHQISIWRVFSH